MAKRMMKWVVLVGIFCVFSVGNAFSEVIPSEQELPEEFSWYGESGAKIDPAYDEQKKGLWWMPENAPEGQEDVEWGNRGYVFVGTKAPVVAETPPPAPEEKVVVRERIVEKPVEKIVYRDRPVEKIVYRDRVVEKPVEKIVYRDRVVEKPVEKIKTEALNLKDVYFAWDSAEITPLAVQILKENADILKAYPKVIVQMVGSASPEGDSDYNKKLSERRVTAVKNYMVNKEGIAANRLKTEAKGEISVDETSWPFVRKVGFLIAD
jgi:outer membrane protein OmpA-like peptidoglycan-associated protein